MGGGEDTARMRINRALEKLRKFLSLWCFDDGDSCRDDFGQFRSSCTRVLAKSVTAVCADRGATASSSTLTLIKEALKITGMVNLKSGNHYWLIVFIPVDVGQTSLQEHGDLATRKAIPYHELKGKWMVGKKYELHMELNQARKRNHPIESQPVKEGLKWTQDFTVSVLKELPAGGWQLELEFLDEAMDESQAGRRILSFDSAQSSAGNTIGWRYWVRWLGRASSILPTLVARCKQLKVLTNW